MCPLPTIRLQFHALFANSSFYWHDSPSAYMCHIIILCHIPLSLTFHVTLSLSCINKQQAKCTSPMIFSAISHSFIHSPIQIDFSLFHIYHSHLFSHSIIFIILFHSHLHSLYSFNKFILLFHTLSLLSDSHIIFPLVI